MRSFHRVVARRRLTMTILILVTPWLAVQLGLAPIMLKLQNRGSSLGVNSFLNC